MKTNDLTHCCEDLQQMVRKHPTRTILATVSAGIVAGVLVRLLYDQQHPTRMDTALNAVHGLGDRVRSLFR
jgi:hypothetical protein